MSVLCAERCGVIKLLDKRFAGEARGISYSNIFVPHFYIFIFHEVSNVL